MLTFFSLSPRHLLVHLFVHRFDFLANFQNQSFDERLQIGLPSVHLTAYTLFWVEVHYKYEAARLKAAYSSLPI